MKKNQQKLDFLWILTLPADAWFAARLLPKFFRFDSLAILEPNYNNKHITERRINHYARVVINQATNICATYKQIIVIAWSSEVASSGYYFLNTQVSFLKLKIKQFVRKI